MIATDYTGKILDEKYEIISLIGEGGMGAVYHGRHMVINKPVAIKFLRGSLTKQEEVVKRFYREAQAAAAIRHSNIIDVMDLGVSPEGEPYLVMEFLEGEGLADYLEHRGALDIATVCAIVEGALVGLDAAHSQGIIHRDIKPDNIYLVNRAGEPLGIKLIDFGISKFLSVPDQTKLTQDGSMLGTPAYMSPEQARGLDVDHRTDLYSMGVIFYQMLTGETPFSGVNYSELLLNMLTTEPKNPFEINPDFPEAARPVVERALKKDPTERFQSAEEMLRTIRALAGVEDRVRRLSLLAADISNKTVLQGGPGDIAVDDTHYAQNLYSQMLKKREDSVTAKRGKSMRLLVSTGFGVVATGFGAMVKGSRYVYRRASVAKWPRRALAAIIRMLGKIVRHPKRVVPISFFGTLVLLVVLLPLLCSEGTKEVTITLENLPKGAVIFFNEVRVEKNPFDVPAADDAAILRVEANGREPFKKEVVPKENRIIDVVFPKDKGARKAKGEKSSSHVKPPPSDKAQPDSPAKAETDDKKKEEPTKKKAKSRRRRLRIKWPFRRRRKSSGKSANKNN
jgi:serine/threonine protein kinase